MRKIVLFLPIVLFYLITLSGSNLFKSKNLLFNHNLQDTIKPILVQDTVKPILFNDSVYNYPVKSFKKGVVASHYGAKFNGRKTASGEIYSDKKLTAAHKKLAFGTMVLVTNIENKKSVIVKINDRGPFTKGKEIDLSHSAFKMITDNKNSGHLLVNIEIIKN